MTAFLNYRFEDTPQTVSTFDELPLWSAYFGMLLLEHIPLKSYSKVLDLGSGAGFPLMELAERLGNDCKCFGLDPWKNANARAKHKIVDYGLSNVEIIDGSADHIPFEDNSIDLIVSNLGVNNFDNPQKVVAECTRVLAPGGSLALTTNLNGHWSEFYNIFEQTLQELDKPDLLPALDAHQEHRGSEQSVKELLSRNGLTVAKTHQTKFAMRFLNGSAFLNHHFIKLGWLEGWKTLIPVSDEEIFFGLLERKLNEYATQQGELRLTVPALYVECRKK